MPLSKPLTTILSLCLLGALTACSPPSNQAASSQTPPTANHSTESTSGWVELTEVAPRVKRTTTLLQKSATTWHQNTETPQGSQQETLIATLEDLATELHSGLPTGGLVPFGMALSNIILDYNPARLQHNLSTYLLQEQITTMKVAGDLEGTFPLTPEMVTGAIQAQAAVGVKGANSATSVRFLSELFAEEWPDCQITLSPSGERSEERRVGKECPV